MLKKGEAIDKNELNNLNKWGSNLIFPLNKKSNDEETCENNNQKNKLKRKSKS